MKKQVRAKWMSGFSVIELMVVVVIMAVIAAASIPAFWGHIESVNLTKGSRQVEGSLKLARTRAVSTNNPVVVVFNSTDGTFFVFEDTDGDGTQDADETTAGPYEVPNRISLNSVSFASETVTFNPNGSASETGTVELSNTKERAQRVDVTAPTGLIYVSDVYALGEALERD